jgi:hypothetical protein
MAEQIMPLEKIASGSSASPARELRNSNTKPDHTPILGDLEDGGNTSTFQNFLRNFSTLWQVSKCFGHLTCGLISIF